MSKSYWRERAREVIQQVLESNEGKSMAEIRKALREDPFGERAMHPYKIWCDEVKILLGEKKVNHYRQRAVKVEADPRQMELM